jgi:hypothetical protein
MNSRERIAGCGAACVILLVAFAAMCFGQNDAATVQLTGKVVRAESPWLLPQLKTESGAAYTLISNRISSALFVDTNLATKTLLVKGRVWEGTRNLELTGNLRSIRDGKVYELYYYCDICAITGIDPGPCMCCRDPVRLVEQIREEAER